MRFSIKVKTRKGLTVPSLILSRFISTISSIRFFSPLALISSFLIAQTFGTIDCAHAQKGSPPKSAPAAKTPKVIQAHETAGYKAYGEGHFQIAIKEFTIVLNQQPQRVDIILVLNWAKNGAPTIKSYARDSFAETNNTTKLPRSTRSCSCSAPRTTSS